MLKVNDIRCEYNGQAILKSLSFVVNSGDICCLLGPSGCGKTTALRAIAGFKAIDHGSISLNDKLISTPGHTTEPEQRNIGMVFQDFALFPHLTVTDNIRFGINKDESSRQVAIVDSLLELVKLGDIKDRYPHELSGGQQQRVALARALAPNPQLLLMDEPFSNLDVDLRRHLNLEVREILKEFGTTAILVTHDQEEAFAFGDFVGLLNEGTLQQWDTPFNLYHEPCNRFVANFIGQGSMIPGLAVNPTTVKTELGTIVGNRAYNWHVDTPLDILIRPDDITLANDGGIETQIVKKVFSGSSTIYTLRLPTGSTVESLFPSHHDYQVGDSVSVTANIEHLIAFSPDD